MRRQKTNTQISILEDTMGSINKPMKEKIKKIDLTQFSPVVRGPEVNEAQKLTGNVINKFNTIIT